MSTYVIFLKERTKDVIALDEYRSRQYSAAKEHNIELLVAYGKSETTEGNAPEGVVLLKFPNIREAKAWYESPAYKEASIYRLKGADWRVIFVDGV